MKKAILIGVAALALVGATSKSETANAAGTAEERYGFGSKQTITQNFDNHGKFLNYKTDMDLYNHLRTERSGRYVRKFYQAKWELVTTAPKSYSVQGDKRVYNFDENSKPLEENSTNFANKTYLGETIVGGVIYRFWK